LKGSESLYSKIQKIYDYIDKKDLYAYILTGKVFLNNHKECNPKRLVKKTDHILLKQEKVYVSRAGKKLETALKQWDFLEIKDKVFLDAGCSTGGFTDCLLDYGAKSVYAVDVGVNVLDYKLRTDKRIHVYENCNILDFKDYQDIDYAVADLSFRSAFPVVQKILPLIKKQAMIALIKPQFEWKNPPDYFNGIVEKQDLYRVLEPFIEKSFENNIYIHDILASDVKGKKGNQEFLFYLHLEKTKEKQNILDKLQNIIDNL